MLTSVRVHEADALDSLSFQRQTVVAYGAVRQALREVPECHPLRFWNLIPNIQRHVSESLSRYMVFNAGRYSAFLGWYGTTGAFRRSVATASGVGHRGSDLVVHCLSSRTPGIAIENPRQIPSFRYSERYGPLPPTFARATVCRADSQTKLLIGGTASIRGEHSLHHRDLNRQAIETLENLAAVVKAGSMAVDDGLAGAAGLDSWLRSLQYMRVYYPRTEDRAALHRIVAGCCPEMHEIEWVQADLCRPELLVEIEGVALLTVTSHRSQEESADRMQPAFLGA